MCSRAIIQLEKQPALWLLCANSQELCGRAASCRSQDAVTMNTLLECLETHSLVTGLSPINSHFGDVTFQFSINPEKHLLIALSVLPGFATAECHLPTAQEEFRGVVCAPGPCNQSVGSSVTTSSLHLLLAAQVHGTNFPGALNNLRAQKHVFVLRILG